MTNASSVDDIPHLTTEQMIEVDRAMIEDYRIDLIQMMENAGRNLAHLARQRFLDGEPDGRAVTVLAGSGGNGGGALVAARRLMNWGAEVTVILGQVASRMTTVPAHQLDILTRMKAKILNADTVNAELATDLILDGLVGYSLRGAPRGDVANLVRWANDQSAPVLSLDTPSGIDTTTGMVFNPVIMATATMTLALPKQGLIRPEVAPYVGELYLADISVPPELYAASPLDLSVGPIFAGEDVIRLK